jgi:O-succinylbenzoate synthase
MVIGQNLRLYQYALHGGCEKIVTGPLLRNSWPFFRLAPSDNSTRVALGSIQKNCRRISSKSVAVPISSQPLREGLIIASHHGYGEISPLPGFSRETFEEAKAEILAVLKNGATPTLPSVRFGLSCVQRKLSSIHLPLCALGPRPNFPTIKLKLGHLPMGEAIALTKQHLHLNLRLDCNRAWTLDQALHFAGHFKPTDFAYLEEPLQNWEDLIMFSQRTHFPIALDESIHNDWSQIPSLKAIVVKPTIVGYIPEVPSHLDLILSSSYETGLGLLHIAHLAQNTLPIGLDTYRQKDLLINPIQCRDGYFSWQATDPPIQFKHLTQIYP